MKSRNWCFTKFFEDNQDERCIEYLHNWFKENVQPICVRAIAQVERCPQTDRYHLQGYLEFPGGLTFEAVRRKLPSAHIEPRRGSRHDAVDYCRKTESRVDDGGPWISYMGHAGGEDTFTFAVGQGKRNDLSSFIELMYESGLTAAIEDEPAVFVRYHRGLERLNDRRLYDAAQRDCPREVFVLWGDPGTGKSRHVYESHGYQDVYRLPLGSTEWWDHYESQSVVLLDDFYGQIPLSRLLVITDRHPTLLPRKGSFSSATYRTLYITSNVPWTEWYSELFLKYPLLKAALARRFKRIEHYSAPFS